MKKYDLLFTIINGLSGKVNKKALHEVIDNNPYQYEMNDLLFKYYLRVHRQSTPSFYVFVTKDSMTDEKEWLDFLKENDVKRYKKQYDYKNINPIKFHDTGLLVEINNGFITFYHYGFNVDDYIEANSIDLED